VEFSVYNVAMLHGYCIIASVLLFFVCGAYSKGKSSLQYAYYIRRTSRCPAAFLTELSSKYNVIFINENTKNTHEIAYQ